MKTPVQIYSFHTPGSFGGFDWVFATLPEAVQSLWETYFQDWNQQNVQHQIMVTLSIETSDPEGGTGLSNEEITEYIDAHLLDLIEEGSIGQIQDHRSQATIHWPPVSA